MDKWISIKERLPPFDKEVIVYTSIGWLTSMYYSSNKYAKNPKPRFEWKGIVNFPGIVTHWQEYPAPPNA